MGCSQQSEIVDQAATHASLTDEFRRAMRRMAGAVTLLTTRDARGKPHGMAASAVIAVSMEPASLLVSINRQAGMHPVMISENVFCVNVLDEVARDLVATFSRSDHRAARFTAGAWQPGWRDLPYLPSAICSVFCEVDASLEYGTHTLLVGKVRDVNQGTGAVPLLWADGAFARPFATSF